METLSPQSSGEIQRSSIRGSFIEHKHLGQEN